ncbi:hypothetical protein B7494_g703 [Chlorociboria aeruginascens]|nr:hypothetical protein B7494_g703 [Chlorociboria aeruginascens]
MRTVTRPIQSIKSTAARPGESLGDDQPAKDFYPNQASSSNPDQVRSYGPGREMDLPQLEFAPPQPVEIDLNNSRTLPSPASSSSVWDSAGLPQPGFGEMTSIYGPTNMPRISQVPMENQSRAPTQDPLLQWYSANDGPWIPKGISEVLPEERINARAQSGNRMPMSFGTHYRQHNPSDNGTFQYGVPHSDSGYGTRRSDGSILSADVTDRDQDCQSLTSHIAEFQPFPGLNDLMQQPREPRTSDTWTLQELITDEGFEDMIRRAEFWHRPPPNMSQESLPPFGIGQRNPPPTVGQLSRGGLKRRHESVVDWKRVCRDFVDSTQDLTPKRPRLEDLTKSALEDFAAKNISSNPRDPIQHQATVQPLEVFPPPAKVVPTRLSLESVMSPVGNNDAVVKSPAHVSSNRPTHIPESTFHGKAHKPINVSAADAAITEIIQSALVGIIVPDQANERTALKNSGQDVLPNGRPSSTGYRASGPPTARPQGHINSNVPTSSAQDSKDYLTQNKAIAILQSLHDLGYIVQRDPRNLPKPQNRGSVASNKSGHQETCPTCKRFKGRPCELKKHMKRHERPYGCTFIKCNKTFGSKNDWKRHENSQHFHLESWRCDVEKLGGGVCAKVCYRQHTFQDHLKKEHQISDVGSLKIKVENCRMGRNCQARFWCGFCSKLIDLKKLGLEAWTERFDHIDDHFMGRSDFPKQGICDWIQLDNNQPKGDVACPVSPDGSQGSDDSGSDQSGSPSEQGSPEAIDTPGASSGRALNLEDDRQDRKRRRASSDDGARPLNHIKRTRTETIVFCVRNSILDPNPTNQQTSVNNIDFSRTWSQCGFYGCMHREGQDRFETPTTNVEGVRRRVMSGQDQSQPRRRNPGLPVVCLLYVDSVSLRALASPPPTRRGEVLWIK